LFRYSKRMVCKQQIEILCEKEGRKKVQQCLLQDRFYNLLNLIAFFGESVVKKKVFSIRNHRCQTHLFCFFVSRVAKGSDQFEYPFIVI